ncbi:hypothetical protein ABGB21_30350 [Plantactinospora sp. B24E8]
MINLVTRITAGNGTEEEIHSWLDLLDSQIPLPSGYTASLIFYPNRHGLDPEPDPSEVVDRMFGYRPIAL